VAGDGRKIGDAYVEVHMDPDKAVDDAAKKIEKGGKTKIKKAGEKAGKDGGDGIIKGTLAGMDAGDGDIVKKSGEIGKKSGKATADGAEKEMDRRSSRVSVAGAAMFASLPVAALAAGVGVAAGLATVPLVFAGIAIAAQAQNKEVAASFEALGSDVGDSIQSMTKPMRGTLIKVADETKASFDRLKPSFKSIFSDLDDDVMNVTEGVLDLAENAMPGLVTATAKADPVFDGLHKTLAKTGTGLGMFFTNLSEGAGASGEILSDTGTIIEHALGFAGSLFAKLANQGAPAFHEFADVLGQAEDAVLGLAQGALPVLSAVSMTAFGGMGAILRVLQPFAPALGNIATSAFAAKLGFSALNMLSFGNLGKSLDGVKEKIKSASGLTGKMKAAVGGLGSAAGIAGLASAGFGIAMSVMANHEQRAAERAARLRDATETLSEALDKGAKVTSGTYLAALVKVGAEIPKLSSQLQGAGSNLTTAADMAIKGGQAWEDYRNGVVSASDATPMAEVRTSMLTDSLDELHTAQEQATQANVAHELSLRHIASTGLPDVDAALLRMVKSTGDADVATVAASQKTNLLESSMAVLQSTTGETADKIKALTAVMDIYTGRVPDAEEATQALNGDIRSLKDMTKVWTENVSGSQIAIDRHGMSLKAWAASLINADGTINTTTQSGSDFQNILESTQTDLYAQVTALHESGASHAELTKKVQTTREAFIRQATQMGFTKQQAVDLANKYGLIPEKVATTIEGHAQGAMNAIGSVTAGMNKLDGKVAWVYVKAKWDALALSIPHNAEGTSNWSGGLTQLGEKGFELMQRGEDWSLAPGPMVADVQAGTRIYNNQESRQLMSGSVQPLSGGAPSGGGVTINFLPGAFSVDYRTDLQALAGAVSTQIKQRMSTGRI
jgi:hypothetical protein